jgi:hypothetical protein
MKVYVKFIDKQNHEYYYPNYKTYARHMGVYYTKINLIEIKDYAQVLDDSYNYDKQILEELKIKAKQDNLEMQIIPVNNCLGTYLSIPTCIHSIKNLLNNIFNLKRF